MNISDFPYNGIYFKSYPSNFVGIKKTETNFIQNYACKESATRHFETDTEYVFRHGRAKNALYAAINRLEESLGIEPKSEFIKVEGEHTVPIIQVISPFWFSRRLYFDLFCCIWKTLRTKSAAVLNSINTYEDIPNSTYFNNSTSHVRWALANVRELPQILGVKDDLDFLFGYKDGYRNGLITALSAVYYYNNSIRERIKEFSKNRLTTQNKTL